MEFFGIGLPELLVILVLALIVFGPERLPKIARDLGSTLASFRREAEGIRQEFLSSMESVQSPMQDTIQELRSALNINNPPPRPAPLELSGGLPISDELPPSAQAETPVSDATPPNDQSVTFAAPPPASMKAAPPATIAPAATLAAPNGPIVQGVEKHRQPDPAKPLLRPLTTEAAASVAPATPPAPAIPSIEPSSTPMVNRATLAPSLDKTTPLEEPEADALFGHNPFFDDTMIMSAGEAAVIAAAETAAATPTEAAPEAQAAGAHR